MHEVVVMAVKKAVRAATTTFTAISMKRFFIISSFLILALPHRLSMGSGTDVKSLATFSSGPDPSERPRRNARRNALAEPLA